MIVASCDCFNDEKPRVDKLARVDIDCIDQAGSQQQLWPVKLCEDAYWVNAVRQKSHWLVGQWFFSKDLLRLIRADSDGAGLTDWHSQSVLWLVIELGTCVNDGSGVDLNADCSDERALELVSVHEKSHWLHCHAIACPAWNCKNRCILDHVCMAVWIWQVDLESRVVNLDEGWQSDLIVTLLRFIETERVINGNDWGHNLDVLSHWSSLVVQ